MAKPKSHPKPNFATLVTDASSIAAALSPIIASEESNVAKDLAAVAPVLTHLKERVGDFVAFLPTLETAVAVPTADVQ